MSSMIGQKTLGRHYSSYVAVVHDKIKWDHFLGFSDKTKGKHMIKKSGAPMKINHQLPGKGDDQRGRKRRDSKNVFQETPEYKENYRRTSSVAGRHKRGFKRVS